MSSFYFPPGIVCKCTWNAVCLAWMKVMVLCSHYCWFWVGKCYNKVNTWFVVTFSLPTGEKNVTTSQNVKVAGAYGTLPIIFLHFFFENWLKSTSIHSSINAHEKYTMRDYLVKEAFYLSVQCSTKVPFQWVCWGLLYRVTLSWPTRPRLLEFLVFTLTGFPLFRADKIPWLFQYFFPFSSIFLMFYFFNWKLYPF